jgi:3-oxo-4,17-pregnadiene-20-carboxyl-CoA hydratase alpha subunit
MFQPEPTDDDRFYFEGWRQGRLLFQRCRGCGALRHPPSPSCPSCRDVEWEAVQASGRGSIHSYVIPRKPAAVAASLPTPIVVLVDLAEGVRIVSNLVGIEPDAVRFGLPVQVEFLSAGDGLPLPVFRPTAG